MEEMVLGYVRVSTKDQNEDRQILAMQEFGVPKKQIFMDKLSGKDFNRPQYKRLLRRLKQMCIRDRNILWRDAPIN